MMGAYYENSVVKPGYIGFQIYRPYFFGLNGHNSMKYRVLGRISDKNFGSERSHISEDYCITMEIL